MWGFFSFNFLFFFTLNAFPTKKMLSIAARSIKTTSVKSVLGPLTSIRTKVTLPELPYEYNVSFFFKQLNRKEGRALTQIYIIRDLNLISTQKS